MIVFIFPVSIAHIWLKNQITLHSNSCLYVPSSRTRRYVKKSCMWQYTHTTQQHDTEIRTPTYTESPSRCFWPSSRWSKNEYISQGLKTGRKNDPVFRPVPITIHNKSNPTPFRSTYHFTTDDYQCPVTIQQINCKATRAMRSSNKRKEIRGYRVLLTASKQLTKKNE